MGAYLLEQCTWIHESIYCQMVECDRRASAFRPKKEMPMNSPLEFPSCFRGLTKTIGSSYTALWGPMEE